MSHYTTEVRFICENFAGFDKSKGYDKVDDIITASRTKIFDFEYPIFEESYRSVIETKILKHYYTREIGVETVGLWKLKLNTIMNEIMPYYNQLYKSALIKFNPMWDVDLTTEHSGEDIGDKDTTTNFDGNRVVGESENVDRTQEYAEQNVNNGGFDTEFTHSGLKHDAHEDTTDTVYNETKHNEHEDNEWNLFSDTPQGGIDGIENAYDGVSDNTYLSDARNIKKDGSADDTIDGTNNVVTDGTVDVSENVVDNTHNTHNDTSHKSGDVDEGIDRVKNSTEITDNNEVRKELFTNTREWTEKVFGKRNGMTYSKMLLEFRETFLNIDMMVIDELKNLFFLLW